MATTRALAPVPETVRLRPQQASHNGQMRCTTRVAAAASEACEAVPAVGVAIVMAWSRVGVSKGPSAWRKNTAARPMMGAFPHRGCHLGDKCRRTRRARQVVDETARC